MSDKYTKSKKEKTLPEDDSEDWLKSLQALNKKPVVTVSEPKENTFTQLYTGRNWKGVKTVWQCSQCSHQDDKEDDMKLHVLTHYPESDREEILNSMLEKEK